MESFEIAWEEMEPSMAREECFEWVKERISNLTYQLDAVAKVAKKWGSE